MIGYFFVVSFGRYTSAAMRFPSRIGTISLRSMMAMDSSCFSVACLLFTNSGSGGVLCCAERVGKVTRMIARTLNTHSNCDLNRIFYRLRVAVFVVIQQRRFAGGIVAVERHKSSEGNNR